MALPIAATPVLKGEDARSFLKTLEADLEKPARLTPTPKLERARELIKKNAQKRKKRV